MYNSTNVLFSAEQQEKHEILFVFASVLFQLFWYFFKTAYCFSDLNRFNRLAHKRGMWVYTIRNCKNVQSWARYQFFKITINVIKDQTFKNCWFNSYFFNLLRTKPLNRHLLKIKSIQLFKNLPLLGNTKRTLIRPTFKSMTILTN